jgi:D-ribulokinase
MYIGVDVGTSSVRAGIFTSDGMLMGLGVTSIHIFNPQPDVYEQSSDDIWNAVCSSVRKALELSGIDKKEIRGIGFDATCSLVVLDTNKKPLPLLSQGNVIMWMDHRSHHEALELSQTNHPVLGQTGGAISPEMSIAKVMWIYRQKELYLKAGHFIELPEYLTWKCTGSMNRSACSLVCKWAYDGDWHRDFIRTVVEEIDLDGFLRKCDDGLEVLFPGTSLGTVTEEAAVELGLSANTQVGYPVIDAYAGALSTLLSCTIAVKEADLSKKLALICGTSSCHILFTKQPLFVKGVWGPYRNVAVPGWFCTEGGQSLTGKAIQVMLEHHPEYVGYQKDCQSHHRRLGQPEFGLCEAFACSA